MNKKILMLIVSLLVVSMLVIPTVSACRNKRPRIRCMDYTVVLWPAAPGTKESFPGYPKYWPSEDNPSLVVDKTYDNHRFYMINIGGTLTKIDETIRDYQFIGGTSYMEGTHFTYDDGFQRTVEKIDGEDVTTLVTWKWTINFIDETTGIDGSLKMWLKVKFSTLTETTFFNYEWSYGGGYGTGDLRGVFIKASAGTAAINLADLGGPVELTHVGKVYGWPT